MQKGFILGQPHRVLLSFTLARMSSPWLFNLYAKYIMQKAGLDESQAGINCWEKYQQPWICRGYHSNGRKQRGTLDSERVKKLA